MRLLTVSLLAMGIVAGCSTSQSGAQSQSAGGEGLICKRTRTVDSNLPQNVCGTQAQWDAYDKQGRENVDEFNRRRDEVGNPNPL